MAIDVRWATAEDEARIVIPSHVSRAVWLARLRERRVALAEDAGNPVGALHLEYLWGTTPYIALIHVHAPLRRQGIGRALLSFVEAALEAEGHGRLYSSSQVDEREPQAWHRRVGFVECGILSGINPNGVGEVFFVKTILAR